MLKKLCFSSVLTLFLITPILLSSQVDESQTGAWYMYFWNTGFKESRWGLQGDVQYRNWDIIGDLEQLLLRGGLTYTPENSDVKLTLGYAHIETGAFGDSNQTVGEDRIYQEALYPHHLGGRFYLNHRFRFEQRFVESQDFRTRYRYALFLNIALSKEKTITPKTWYVALYDEIFINGQRDIGNGNSVELFDRNRFYVALGYRISNPLRVQFGLMRQTSDNIEKTQLQLSLHHSF